MKLSQVFLFLLMILTPVLAHADMSISTYQDLLRQSEGSKELVQTYIGGVASGFMYANTALQQKGQRPLFCRDAGLDFKEANSIMDTAVATYMRRTGADPNMLVEVLLLVQLQKLYPCA